MTVIPAEVAAFSSSSAAPLQPVALILAGGLGTRLRGAVPRLPKVLAQVGDQPFVFHILEWLSRSRVEQVVMCTGYMADEVMATVGSHFANLRIAYSQELAPLGTGGALRLAFDTQPNLTDPVLALNGDTFASVDLEALMRHHDTHHPAGTLVVAPIADPSRYGTVKVDDMGRVVSFVEKRPDLQAGLVSAGMYVLGRELLSQIPAGRAVSLEQEMFPRWIEQGLSAFKADDGFIDIGTPESLVQAGAWFETRGATFRTQGEGEWSIP